MKKNDILLIPAPDEMNTIFLLLFLISVWMSSCFFCFSLCAAHGYHTDLQPFAVLWGTVVDMLLFINFFRFDKLRRFCSFLLYTRKIERFMPCGQYATTYSLFIWHALAVCFSIYPQTIKPYSSKYSIAAASLLLIDTKRKPALWIQTFFLNCLLKQTGLSCRSLIMQRDRYFLHPLS